MSKANFKPASPTFDNNSRVRAFGQSDGGETHQDNQRPKYHTHGLSPYTAFRPDATWTAAS